ncbi:MAG: PAS domain-containing protein [Burkholderiales bacterium]
MADALHSTTSGKGDSDRDGGSYTSSDVRECPDVYRAIGTFEWIIDLVPLGVLVLDRDRTMVLANKSARTLLAARDGLAVDPRGRCQPVLADARRPFMDRVDKVLGGRFEADAAPHYVKLPRVDGRAPLLTRLVRLPDVQAPSVCVLIRDSAAPCGPSVAALRQLFSLTPAEARLACALANGYTIDEYSNAMGVTRNTTRTQLASVLGKTDTCRQADLIRAIAGLV